MLSLFYPTQTRSGSRGSTQCRPSLHSWCGSRARWSRHHPTECRRHCTGRPEHRWAVPATRPGRSWQPLKTSSTSSRGHALELRTQVRDSVVPLFWSPLHTKNPHPLLPLPCTVGAGHTIVSFLSGEGENFASSLTPAGADMGLEGGDGVVVKESL